MCSPKIPVRSIPLVKYFYTIFLPVPPCVLHAVLCVRVCVCVRVCTQSRMRVRACVCAQVKLGEIKSEAWWVCKPQHQQKNSQQPIRFINLQYPTIPLGGPAETKTNSLPLVSCTYVQPLSLSLSLCPPFPLSPLFSLSPLLPSLCLALSTPFLSHTPTHQFYTQDHLLSPDNSSHLLSLKGQFRSKICDQTDKTG